LKRRESKPKKRGASHTAAGPVVHRYWTRYLSSNRTTMNISHYPKSAGALESRHSVLARALLRDAVETLSACQLESAQNWYPIAANWAIEAHSGALQFVLDGGCGDGAAALALALPDIGPGRVYSAVAALSPRVGWRSQLDRFVPFCIEVLASPEASIRVPRSHPGFGRNRTLAARYLTGVDVPNRMGPKTGPFRDALAGDPTAVVVDVHISRAFGILRADGSIAPADRKSVQSAILGAAAESRRTVGRFFEAREVQSILWTHHVGDVQGLFRAS
jgi:hypothetical protein